MPVIFCCLSIYWLYLICKGFKAFYKPSFVVGKYSSAMCHAGLVNNSLVTDYDIGVLPSEYQDYLKSMVGVQHPTFVVMATITLAKMPSKK
jgi:hypothetical protein